MKGKPIEPGCLAITVNAFFTKNKGKIVRVKSLFAKETSVSTRIWLCDFTAPTHVRWMGRTIESMDAHMPESYLRRIDDDEDLSGEDVDTNINHDIEVTA